MARLVSAAALAALLCLFSGTLAFPERNVEEALNGIVSVVDGAINASIGRSLSSDSREYFGDSYLDWAREQCATARGPTESFFPCVKFRALRFVHRLASPDEDAVASKIVLSDAVHLVRSAKSFQEKIFPSGTTEDDQRSGAYELDRLARFGLRELERFANSHAVAFRVGSSDSESAARLIDEDSPEKGDLFQEARGRKKKLALLVPLLMLIKFIKLKALLVPILFSVLIIKKILILFAVFFPSILGFFRFCRPQQNHGYEYSSPSTEYGATGYGGMSYGKENHYSRRSLPLFDAQTRAYRAYAPTKEK
ncbi:uncharacterized protein LOC124174035 [Ischnura elegans]|uniref:uncharacterized protein LOC124174035 n=1 Tax=Ischnura elegans TaxID=197161 RepID=UPI001ED8A6D5|nr:uncharacterized protein LOC124174035 [Ischnura elegans]